MWQGDDSYLLMHWTLLWEYQDQHQNQDEGWMVLGSLQWDCDQDCILIRPPCQDQEWEGVLFNSLCWNQKGSKKISALVAMLLRSHWRKRIRTPLEMVSLGRWLLPYSKVFMSVRDQVLISETLVMRTE